METNKVNISCYRFYRWPEKKRIVCIGKRVVVLDEKTLETVHTFHRPLNPSFVYADDQRFIIMSNVGQFAVYRLPDMAEDSSFQLKEIENTDDGFLYDAARNQILTIAATRFGQKLFTINIGNRTIQSKKLPQSYEEENVTLHSLLLYDGAFCRLQCERNVNGSGYFSTVLFRDNKEVKQFNFEMCPAQQISSNLYYDSDGIADFHTGKYWNFQDMGLADAVIYSVSKTREGYAVATGEKLFFCDKDFHIIESVNVKYAADYLETERYALIGTWEKVLVKPF